MSDKWYTNSEAVALAISTMGNPPSRWDLIYVDLIKVEGGDSNDPNDPGGRTRFGIAQNHHPGVDVPNLQIQKAKLIARSQYWDSVNADSIPVPLDFFVFDYGFNSGPARACRDFRIAAGLNAYMEKSQMSKNKIDAAAIASIGPDLDVFTCRFGSYRMSLVSQLKAYNASGKGLFNRIFYKVYEYAKSRYNSNLKKDEIENRREIFTKMAMTIHDKYNDIEERRNEYEELLTGVISSMKNS